jgi:cytochrome c-type biogenesis protein CcmH
MIPVMAIAGYFKLGAPHFITPAQSSATENSTTDAATHLPANFSEMVDKLAARLEKQPTDAEGWYMLARSYTFLKQYDKAIPAYNKVLDIRGKTDPQLLTDLAETIALTKDGSFTGQAAELLQTALKLDPNYSQALWLSGFAAAQTENYQGAIDYWQRALAQISPDDVESKQMLEQEIATVRKLIPTTNEPNLTDAYATPTTAVQLEIHVKIDSQLQNRINPEDTLFIYAQATTGAPMPLAIVKKTAGELPITTTLNDNHAVMPTLKLSSVKEVTVLARISKSGLATAQPGDLQGKMTPIILGQQRQVNLLIDEIIP